jgi:hypothetical protein
VPPRSEFYCTCTEGKLYVALCCKHNGSACRKTYMLIEWNVYIKTWMSLRDLNPKAYLQEDVCVWYSDVHPMEHLKVLRIKSCTLTLSLLMSYNYIYGAPSKSRYLTYIYIYGRDFLLGILLLEPCISLIYAWKTKKYTNYSFSLLITYGSSYMFRHYISIIRERS